MLTTFLMISQQYHSMNSVTITTTISIPAITPATIPKLIELFLLDVFCCTGVVGSVRVMGWVGLWGVESVGLSEGNVEWVGLSDVVGLSVGNVNSLLFVTSYIRGQCV